MNLKLFSKELILFAIVQSLGIFVALRLVKFSSLTYARRPELTFYDLLSLIIFIAIFILIIRKFKTKKHLFYKTFLAIALFAGTQIVFGVFLSSSLAFISALVITFAVFKTKRVWIHNLAMLLALSGIGANIGISVSSQMAVLILLILSFYDIIAVYKTKHMLQMAKDMIKSRAISGIILPNMFRGWSESLDNVKPGEEFMILGSGDVLLPLLLSASLVNFSLKSAIIVALFAMIGLFVTHILFVSQEQRRPMAALPPIATMSIIGYLVSMFI